MNDGGETIVELGIGTIGGVIDSDREKKGCFIMLLLILCFSCLLFYFINKNESPSQIKGIVINKLDDNKLIIRTKDGDKIYNVTEKLYLNKNINDSVILKKK